MRTFLQDPRHFNVSLQGTQALLRMIRLGALYLGGQPGTLEYGTTNEKSGIMKFWMGNVVKNDNSISIPDLTNITVSFDQMFGYSQFMNYQVDTAVAPVTTTNTDLLTYDFLPFPTGIVGGGYGIQFRWYPPPTGWVLHEVYNSYTCHVQGVCSPCGIKINIPIRYDTRAKNSAIGAGLSLQKYAVNSKAFVKSDPKRAKMITYETFDRGGTWRSRLFFQKSGLPYVFDPIIDLDTSYHKESCFFGDYSMVQAPRTSGVYGATTNWQFITSTMHMGFRWYIKPWWQMTPAVQNFARFMPNGLTNGAVYYEGSYIYISPSGSYSSVGAYRVHTTFVYGQVFSTIDDAVSNYCVLDWRGFHLAKKLFLYGADAGENWGYVDDVDWNGGIIYGYHMYSRPSWNTNFAFTIPVGININQQAGLYLGYRIDYINPDTLFFKTNPAKTSDMIVYDKGTYEVPNYPQTISDLGDGWLTADPSNVGGAITKQQILAEISTASFDPATTYIISVDGNNFSASGATVGDVQSSLLTQLNASVIVAVSNVTWDGMSTDYLIRGISDRWGVEFTVEGTVSGGAGEWASVDNSYVPHYTYTDW